MTGASDIVHESRVPSSCPRRVAGPAPRATAARQASRQPTTPAWRDSLPTARAPPPRREGRSGGRVPRWRRRPGRSPAVPSRTSLDARLVDRGRWAGLDRRDDRGDGLVGRRRHRAESVTLVVEVAVPTDVSAAEHLLAVELEVDDRAIDVGGVEGHGRVVGDEHALQRAMTSRTSVPSNEMGSTCGGSVSVRDDRLQIRVQQEADRQTGALGQPRQFRLREQAEPVLRVTPRSRSRRRRARGAACRSNMAGTSQLRQVGAIRMRSRSAGVERRGRLAHPVEAGQAGEPGLPGR